ncbi:HAD-IC family P-type ATPase [Corynebacterium mendelii]|uniref:HAD-IC family P-type ATPase n=1 Tax=Corynebacterium mendelii TaxID=2765362 RepID=A0A939E2V0_9CORY|nr:HAD-IC family P-type ATPase [Corynebacterium mendelii]MBN9644671.1 HAD-IC family P-type ATPase [Corynebacterium mendelii]
MSHLSVPDTGFTTPATGLSAPQVTWRISNGCTNDVVRRAGRRTVDIIASNVFTRINAILGVLLVIVLFTGSLINAAFGLLIVANSAIGIIQELRAKRTLEKLTVLGESKPRVIRDGRAADIPRENIVLDDLIDLGPGDQLVVDGIVRTASSLRVDESMLTGESVAVHKHPGDPILSGSFIKSGSGTYQATAIGSEAYSAKLVAEAGRFTLTGSQLQAGIDKILKVITWLLVPVGALTIYTQLYRTGEPLKQAILSMVGSIVPMVPEGLVLMTSIAFAVGVVRLGKHQALINELPAIEGLARVDVVCADKTGTLTENAMVVDHITALDSRGRATTDHTAAAENRLVTVLAMIAAADEHPNDTIAAIKDTTLKWCAQPEKTMGTVTGRVEFDAAVKWSGIATGAGGSWVIGAPEVLLAPGHPALDEAAGQFAKGLRVLVVAEAEDGLQAVTATPAHPGCGSLRPVGLVVLNQKVRADAAGTLAFFAAENVETKIISGDNAASVGAVAAQVGITPDGDRPDPADFAVDARTLPEAGTEEFADAVEKGRVFGRVTPEQKRDMVKALIDRGHQVAMTGDGVNDVLALKDASIGVSMGSGSPATRSVAQVVLLDNRFSTLPKVVAEGRRVIGNIERVANLFLTKTIYSVVLAVITGVLGMAFPFQPIHVTMTGWFTIGIPAFILSLAPNHDRARPGFAARVLKTAFPWGVITGVVTVTFWAVHNPGSEAEFESLQKMAATATLSTMLVMALWVLAVVARPWNLWKAGLLMISVGAYFLLFLMPWTSRILLLDVSNTQLMVESLVWGAVGCLAIEAVWIAVRRREHLPLKYIDTY